MLSHLACLVVEMEVEIPVDVKNQNSASSQRVGVLLDSVSNLKFEKSRSDFRTVVSLFLPFEFSVEACPHLLRVPIFSYP